MRVFSGMGGFTTITSRCFMFFFQINHSRIMIHYHDLLLFTLMMVVVMIDPLITKTTPTYILLLPRSSLAIGQILALGQNWSELTRNDDRRKNIFVIGWSFIHLRQCLRLSMLQITTFSRGLGPPMAQTGSRLCRWRSLTLMPCTSFAHSWVWRGVNGNHEHYSHYTRYQQ